MPLIDVTRHRPKINEDARLSGLDAVTLVAAFLITSLFAAFAPCSAAATGSNSSAPPAIARVEIRFFFQPGCDECALITNRVLPLAVAQFGDLLNVVEMPLDVASNRAELVAALNREAESSNEKTYIDVARRHLLAGAGAIEKDIAAAVNMAISEPPLPGDFGDGGGAVALSARFTVAGVIAAGLLDSVNPCAIAALIFLVSVLSLAREKPLNVLAAGFSYCLGVFVTYTAIGFGLLRTFRAIEAFPSLRTAVDLFLCGLLAVLSFLSFRDAALAASSRPRETTLRLPDSLSTLVRAIIRRRFGPAAGVASAFIAGAVVTAVETVCTGQVYGPTLAIIVAEGKTAWREAGLLVLYNLMFVMPLLVILLLTWRGMSLSVLLAWSARNAVVAKILMGLLFAALLAFLIAARMKFWTF